MIKYAVIVEPVSRNPWTESLEDTYEEACVRAHMIENNIRNLKVSIEMVEVGKEWSDGNRNSDQG